eukprot:g1234.t1
MCKRDREETRECGETKKLRKKKKTNVHKISKFDHYTCDVLSKVMNKALKEVEDVYGLKVKFNGYNFSDTEVRFKMNANIVGENGKPITRIARAWERIAPKIGCGHLSVGDKVKLKNRTFTLAGWNHDARKYPVTLKDRYGETIVCTAGLLKEHNPDNETRRKRKKAKLESVTWTYNANKHGLGNLKLGDKLEIKGKTFTVAAWNEKDEKCPVELRDVTGKLFNCSPQKLKKKMKNAVVFNNKIRI